MEQDFAYRAKVLITQRRYQEAVRLCRGGLLANPDHVEGKIVLAMALLALRQFDQVRHEMTSLVQQRPDSADARRLLGEAYLRLGDRDRARNHLEAALHAQPEDAATVKLLEEIDQSRRGAATGPRWAEPQDIVTVPSGPPLFPEEEEEPTATSPRPSPTVLPGLVPGLPPSPQDPEPLTVRHGHDGGPDQAAPPRGEDAATLRQEISPGSSPEGEDRTEAIELPDEPPPLHEESEADLEEPTEVDPTSGSAEESLADLMPEEDEGEPDETVVDPDSVQVMAPVLRALDAAEKATDAAKRAMMEETRSSMVADAEKALADREEAQGSADVANRSPSTGAAPEGSTDSSVDGSVEELGSADIVAASGGSADSSEAALDGSVDAAFDEVFSAHPDESVDDEGSSDAGPADPEATRMLDAASAAIVRAQASAPSNDERRTVARQKPSTKSLELRRDHEGTDSFSDVAEATLVDEESMGVMKDQLRPSPLGDSEGAGDDSVDESRDSSADVGRPQIEDLPPPRDPGDERAPSPPPPPPPPPPPVASGSPSPGAEGSHDGPSEGPKPKTTLPLGFTVSEPGTDGDGPPPSPPLASPPPPPPPPALHGAGPSAGRDPGLSTAVVHDEGDEDEDELTVSEIPGGSRKALEGLREVLRGGSDGAAAGADDKPSSPPPPPAGTPPSVERPAGPGSHSSSVDEIPSLDASLDESPEPSPPSGDGRPVLPPARGEDSDPLDQPLDPDEFPRSRLPLPDPEKSIPLRTGDLMMDGGGSSDAEMLGSADVEAIDDSVDAAPPPPPPPPASEVMEDPLDLPFKPEDFSSHRIPLPEAVAPVENGALDEPLSPDDFDSSSVKVGTGYRPLPPISPLDQPISPDDFTPGPRPRPRLSDPLSEPFWPEDFEDGGEADLKSKAFRFGRTQAPANPPAGESAPPPRFPSAPPPPPPPPPPPRLDPVPAMSPPPPAAPAHLPETVGPGPSPAMASPSPLPSPIGEPLHPAASPMPPPPVVSPEPPIDRPSPAPTVFPPEEVDPALGDVAARARRHAAGLGAPDSVAVSGRSDQSARGLPKAVAARKPTKKKGGPLKLVLAGVGAAAVIAATVFGVMTFLSRREVNLQRDEARHAMAACNYQDYVSAARTYDTLISGHPGDEELLAETARIRAMMALEFGTEDDDEAATHLVKQATEAGATAQVLAPARAAINLYRGELSEADQVLTAVQSSTGDGAAELIYLRGLWHMRQGRAGDAWRQFSAAAETNPNDVRMPLALARALHAQKNHTEALQKLQDAETISPRNVAVRLLRAQINIETGRDPSEGDAAARSVLAELSGQASPGQLGWAKLLRARYLAGDKRREAREQANAARQSRPSKDAEFAGLLAETFLKLGEPATAREEAEEAVSLAPHLPEYRLLLAEALLEEGDLTRAEGNLRTTGASPKASLLLGRILFARGDMSGAAQRFEAAAAGEREAPSAKLYLSRIHLRQGRAKAAIDILVDLAEGPPTLPEAWSLLGEAYLTTGELDEAETALKRARGELPADPRVAVNLGKLHARRGHYEEAVAAVDAALSTDPALPEALATRGALHLDAGEYTEAAQAYDKALATRPTAGEALVGRARVATAQGELTRAEELLTKATKGAPQGLLLLARGELKLRQYHLSDAAKLLQEAAEAMPGNPLPQALLGDAYLRQGPRSARRAGRAYSAALRSRKSYPLALVGRAEAALVRGSGESGIKQRIRDAEEAMGTTRPVPERLKARLWAVQGRFYYDMRGDPEAAREWLTKSLSVFGDNADAHMTAALVAEESTNRREACEHYREFLRIAKHGPRADVRIAEEGQRMNCR